MKPKFEPTDDGLEIIDPIERHRYRLTTHRSVDPVAVDTERIQFPVDAAVEITTEMVTLPTSDLIYVRDENKSMVEEVQPADQVSLPEREYIVDLSGPMKTYAKIDSAIQVYSDNEHTYISLDDLTAITIGARSFHTRPAETVETTTEPTDVMDAVTAFGSALKTLTPERSYPTLRGHPPKVEIGDEVAVPPRLKGQNSDVRIEIPPTLEHIFISCSLAYYLGAEVVPGSDPRIATDTGYVYPLDGDRFANEIERILKQVFFLDCVVRTEGLTPLPLHERRAVDQKLEFDPECIYECPPADRIETYLQVSYDDIEPHIPDWQLEIHVEPVAETVEFLPFIANDLAVVKIDEGNISQTPSSKSHTQAIEDFVRGCSTRATEPPRDSKVTESSPQSATPTVSQSWEIDDGSVIESTTPLSAYHNGIGRTPREDPLEIKVVCNDREMRKELEKVNGVYGTRTELPFDVTVYYDLTREELESMLATESDFLHYIGHIDDEGFQCSDGKLDGAAIDSTGVKAFLLNACQSYDQGIHLINSGSIGGIVTFDEIVNSGAIDIGNTIARLLNRGYPLYATLEIAQRKNIIGKQYRLVGNGMTTIAQSKTGGPTVCSVNDRGKETRVSINTYSTLWTGRGSVFTPHIESVDEYYVSPGKTGQITVTSEELEEYLRREQIPVITDDGVNWSESYAENEL